MENEWLWHAKRLQAIASTGLHFSHDTYHRERFQEVLNIAHAMLSRIGGEPIDRIRDLYPALGRGYATPMVDVRAAVIRDGQILLVREKTDGLWTMPGGYADVGFSPAENVIKEVREEAGLTVSVLSLYSVRHKAAGPYEADARDFYKMFFLCRVDGDTAPIAGVETSEARFFHPRMLPTLSRGRIVERDIEDAFAFDAKTMVLTAFD